MTDTARNIEHLDPVSTDGIEDFFDVEIEGVTQLKQLEIIQDLMQKLEGANYRVGWLESQLREREADVHELKLLVDSKHKPGWWQRFKQIWQKQ